MNEWIKCSERLPESRRYKNIAYPENECRKILVKISNTYFVATVIESGFFFLSNAESIAFHIDQNIWVIPSHFKEPEYWMEIPDVPND